MSKKEVVNTPSHEETEKMLLNGFRRIYQHLDASIWGTDMVNYKNMYVSPGSVKVYGYELDEFASNANLWFDVIIPEDKHLTDNFIADLSNGYPVDSEYRIKTRAGEIKWVEVRMIPTLNEDGKLVFIDGITQDITARKLAELGVLKSEEQFKNLIESISGVYWVNDIDNRTQLYISPSYEKLWGRTLQSLYKNPASFIESIHPEDQPRLFQAYNELPSLKKMIINYRIVRPDGEIRWIKTKINVETKSDGRSFEYGYAEDITDQVLAEKGLIEKEKELIEAQEIGRIGSFTYNFSEDKWSCSQVLEDLTGLDDEAVLIYENWVALIHPDWRDETMDRVNYIIMHSKKIDGVYLDTKIVRADNGAERWVSVMGKIEYDSDGKALNMKGTVQDVTERKNAEFEIQRLNESLEAKVQERTAQLVHANQELETFNYTVSHDLKNPINAIMGFSRLLIDDFSEVLDKEANEYLSIISKSSEKMNTLIRDLLDFSRLSKAVVSHVQVDMNKLVSDVLNDLERSGLTRNTKIHLEELEPAICDPRLMQIVWENIIMNGVKYSSKSEVPTIEIGVVSENDKPVYYVKDNGIGFDMDQSDKLFTAFQRLANSPGYEGSGVGLAIVDRIVSKHGGRVWAVSEKDKGAVFYFTLP